MTMVLIMRKQTIIQIATPPRTKKLKRTPKFNKKYIDYYKFNKNVIELANRPTINKSTQND